MKTNTENAPDLKYAFWAAVGALFDLTPENGPRVEIRTLRDIARKTPADMEEELRKANEELAKLQKELDGVVSSSLSEAWEAMKGQIFGPVDPALVKLKHKEIIEAAKEKREQEIDSRGRHSLARDDHDRDRKDRENQTRTLTWLLANSPAYAALHADAVQSWRDTEEAADDALRQIEAALEAERIEHQKLLERAPLVNGKRVFREDDGSVWTEDDVRLPDEIAAGIQLRGDEPTRKEFKAAQARIDELIRSGDRIRGIQVEVADLGAELNDDKNPPSEERTEEIKEEFKTYRQEIKELMPSARRPADELSVSDAAALPSATSSIPVRTF